MHKKTLTAIILVGVVLVNSWLMLGNVLNYKFEVDEVWHSNAAKAMARQAQLDTYLLLNYAIYFVSAAGFAWLLLRRHLGKGYTMRS